MPNLPGSGNHLTDIKYRYVWRECERCEGTGRLAEDSEGFGLFEECPVCDGNGKVEIEEAY
jgi:DnaJ-class molecular chaperone